MMITESLRLREGGDTRSDQTQGDTSSNQAQIYDITKHLKQFSSQQERELFKEKATVTAEQEQREQAIHSLQDDLARLEAAEERRGLPPSTENHLPLGLHPQRYPAVGDCGDCVSDYLKIARLHTEIIGLESEVETEEAAITQAVIEEDEEKQEMHQKRLLGLKEKILLKETDIGDLEQQIKDREADSDHK